MRWLTRSTALVLAVLLSVGVWNPARAEYSPAVGETAGDRLLGLQILKGKYEDDALALKDEITRAELVTVIVRAFGQEQNAALLNGSSAYPDTASHWASGNIAMAKALVEKVGGDAIGMPDGSFAPDAKLTPAQAVAFLMKFLGIKADATKQWPAAYLDVAVEKGLLTSEDATQLASMSNDNATRGLVFYLFDRAFYSYDLGDGKTFYTKYVDRTQPVITLNKVEPTTLDNKVTVSGKVEGANELTVGGQAVTVDMNGNFSVDYALPRPGTYDIRVVARDLAGNTAEAAVKVVKPGLAMLSVTPAQATLAVGQAVQFTAVGQDQLGSTVEIGSVEWSATGGAIGQDGSFKATEPGVFFVNATVRDGNAVYTAGAKVSVSGGPAALKADAIPNLTANGHDRWKLAVFVVDENGTADASGQAPVTVRVADGEGLTVNGGTEATVAAENGVAAFTLQTTTTVTDAGRLVITSGDLTGTEVAYTTVRPTATAIAIHASSTQLKAGGRTTITIQAEDFYGNRAPVAADTRVQISGLGEGHGTGLEADGSLTIPAGSTAASFTYSAGDGGGTVVLTASAEWMGSSSVSLRVEGRPSSNFDPSKSYVEKISDLRLLVVVRDSDGRFVPGLTFQDFTIDEGGKPTFTVIQASEDGEYYYLDLHDPGLEQGPHEVCLRVKGVTIGNTFTLMVPAGSDPNEY